MRFFLMYDPKYIAGILKDLIGYVERHTQASSDMQKEALFVQRNAKEFTERAFHNSSIKKDQALEDMDNVSREKIEGEKILALADDATNNAQALLSEVNRAMNIAKKTLTHWNLELEKALEWLQRAQDWLDSAWHQLERATSECNDAGDSLDYAIDRLQRCQNSDNRYNDCSSEARDVQYAEERLNEARYQVQLAEEEVDRARDEVARAEERVARCERAVEYAENAVESAGKAMDRAELALNSAERTREDSKTCLRLVNEAKEKAENENKTADKMVTNSIRARVLNEDAAFQYTVATNALESAYRLSFRSRQDIEHRIDELLKVDQPTLKL